MNSIKLEIASKNNNKIFVKQEIQGDWGMHFYKNVTPWIEYQMDVSSVPDSVLLVPFVSNVLPFAWLCDAEIIVDKLDKTFVDEIDNIKKGYIDMYSMFEWKGKLTAAAEENVPVAANTDTACFFSGGVDAWTTLMKHLDEKPALLSVWGADVKCDDEKSWEIVSTANKKTADDFGLKYQVIKSNFRETINHDTLSKMVEKSGDCWWHAFQHGISLIAHAAPLAYLEGYKKLYIASSYPETMAGQYTCASDPTIDNYVNFCGCKTIHDGREFDRLGKIRFLMGHSEDKLSKMNLRVCWQAESSGKNCCRCEKCYRTILEIVSVAAPGGVERYGFTWKDEDIKQCEKDFKRKITLESFNVAQFYPPVQQEFIKNKDKIPDYEKYKWLINMNFDKFNDFPVKKIKRNYLKVRHFLGKIKRMVLR